MFNNGTSDWCSQGYNQGNTLLPAFQEEQIGIPVTDCHQTILLEVGSFKNVRFMQISLAFL